MTRQGVLELHPKPDSGGNGAAGDPDGEPPGPGEHAVAAPYVGCPMWPGHAGVPSLIVEELRPHDAPGVMAIQHAVLMARNLYRNRSDAVKFCDLAVTPLTAVPVCGVVRRHLFQQLYLAAAG
jgi:hypothetical protein